jgi:hypothetical protein
MLTYYPHDGATERITWYGGESTQLHYEVEVDDYKGDPAWIERHCKTLMQGMPTGVKELQQAMSDYYQFFHTA